MTNSNKQTFDFWATKIKSFNEYNITQLLNELDAFLQNLPEDFDINYKNKSNQNLLDIFCFEMHFNFRKVNHIESTINQILKLFVDNGSDISEQDLGRFNDFLASYVYCNLEKIIKSPKRSDENKQYLICTYGDSFDILSLCIHKITNALSHFIYSAYWPNKLIKTDVNISEAAALEIADKIDLSTSNPDPKALLSPSESSPLAR